MRVRGDKYLNLLSMEKRRRRREEERREAKENEVEGKGGRRR